MKRTLLLACGLLIALFQTNLSAQTNTTAADKSKTEYLNDTLMLLLPDGNKMIITGKPLKTLMVYTQADSIKELFVNDYEKAITSGTLTVDAPLIHYFVHPSGKRRLKAEVGEYADNKVDVAYEITRLNLDLPKYRYHIHDLQSEIELQVYVQNPAQLRNILSNINVTAAIKAAGKEKRPLRKIVKTEIAASNGQFKIDDIKGHTLQSIEINPMIGVTLIGNVMAPVLGMNASFGSKTKYGISSYKIGYTLSAFPIVGLTGGEMSSVAFIQSHEIRFLKNLNTASANNPFWMGVQAGMLTCKDLAAYDNAIKAGVSFNTGSSFTYSFDYIRDNNKHGVFGFTVKLDF
ncbi:MAG: hypothetical protein V4590_00275 [Bacteroidota bacterium]